MRVDDGNDNVVYKSNGEPMIPNVQLKSGSRRYVISNLAVGMCKALATLPFEGPHILEGTTRGP